MIIPSPKVNIDEVRINRDMVLILPEADYSKVGGLVVSDVYEPERHINPFGEVVIVPQMLNYQGYNIRKIKNKKSMTGLQKKQTLIQRSPMEWDTDIEIEKGDRVMFRYIHQLDDSDTIYLNDTKYLNIPYGSLIARFREDEVFPLNGYVLIEEKSVEEQFIGVKRSVNSAVVAYVGSKIRQHLHYNIPECEVSTGDEILYYRGRAVNIEYDLHKTLGRIYPLMRIHRKDIVSITSHK